jgi:hypothetical protein
MTDNPNSSSSPEPTGSDPVALWKSQPTTAFRLSPAAIAAAEHEHARLRYGVTAKSAVMLIFLVLALYCVVTVDVSLIRVGSLAAAVAYGHVLYSLQRTRRGDVDAAAAEREGAGLAAPSLVHYRAALVRERDRLTGRRLWLPFAVAGPAGVVGMLGIAQARPVLQRYVWVELALFAMAMPLALLYGRHQGRQFETRIDDLDALTGRATSSR